MDDQLLQEVLKGIRDDVKDVKTDIRQISVDVSNINRQTGINTRGLEEHMRRTEAAESRLDIMEHTVTQFQASVNSAIKIGALIASTIVFFTQVLPVLLPLIHRLLG